MSRIRDLEFQRDSAIVCLGLLGLVVYDRFAYDSGFPEWVFPAATLALCLLVPALVVVHAVPGLGRREKRVPRPQRPRSRRVPLAARLQRRAKQRDRSRRIRRGPRWMRPFAIRRGKIPPLN